MLSGVITSALLFLALLAGLEVGRWLGRRRREASEAAVQSSGAAEGVVFAVLGLLTAFTFTSSAAHFNDRRQLIVEQANALGTAWLRVDILAEADRPAIRAKMAQWARMVSETAAVYRDFERREEYLATAAKLQSDTWDLSVAAIERLQSPQLASFVLSPQNDWIDLTSQRQAMDKMGPPPMVLPTLILLALAASVLAGFGMAANARRNLFHSFAFAAAISLAIYVILDLKNPRSGLISVDAMDETMAQLSRSFDAQLIAPPTP